MVEDGVLGAPAGMVAHEEGRAHPAVNALDHGEGSLHAGDQAGTRVQLLDEDVASHVVPVGDDELLHAGLYTAFDGGIDVHGHDAAEAGMVGRTGGHVVPGGDPGDAFHVAGDENFHGEPPLPPQPGDGEYCCMPGAGSAQDGLILPAVGVQLACRCGMLGGIPAPLPGAVRPPGYSAPFQDAPRQFY